jgi:hypothetical protein
MEDRIIGGITCSVTADTIGDGIDTLKTRRVTVQPLGSEKRATIEWPEEDMKAAGATNEKLADYLTTAISEWMSDNG